jgi:hypothetical protein
MSAGRAAQNPMIALNFGKTRSMVTGNLPLQMGSFDLESVAG